MSLSRIERIFVEMSDFPQPLGINSKDCCKYICLIHSEIIRDGVWQWDSSEDDRYQTVPYSRARRCEIYSFLGLSENETDIFDAAIAFAPQRKATPGSIVQTTKGEVFALPEGVLSFPSIHSERLREKARVGRDLRIADREWRENIRPYLERLLEESGWEVIDDPYPTEPEKRNGVAVRNDSLNGLLDPLDYVLWTQGLGVILEFTPPSSGNYRHFEKSSRQALTWNDSSIIRGGEGYDVPLLFSTNGVQIAVCDGKLGEAADAVRDLERFPSNVELLRWIQNPALQREVFLGRVTDEINRYLHALSPEDSGDDVLRVFEVDSCIVQITSLCAFYVRFLDGEEPFPFGPLFAQIVGDEARKYKEQNREVFWETQFEQSLSTLRLMYDESQMTAENVDVVVDFLTFILTRLATAS